MPSGVPRSGPGSGSSNERPRNGDIPVRDPLRESIEHRANEEKVAKRRLWLAVGLVAPIGIAGAWWSDRRSRRGGFGGSGRSSGG